MPDPTIDELEAEYQASLKKPAASEPSVDDLEAEYQAHVKKDPQSEFYFGTDANDKPIKQDEVDARSVDLMGKIRGEGEAAATGLRMPAAGLVGLANLPKGIAKAAERVEAAKKPDFKPEGTAEAVAKAGGDFARDTVLLAPAAGPLGAVAAAGGEAAIPAARTAAGAIAGPAGQAAVDMAAPVAGQVAKHYAGAAAVGSTISGVSAALEQMAKRGEVDPSDVRDAMVMGAPAGMVFQAGADAATMALQARASGAAGRVFEAVKNRIEYELNEVEYRAQRGQGLDLPGEKSQYELVPYDVKKAVAEGRLKLGDALKMSTKMYEERLAAERASVPQHIKAEALMPQVDLLVKSGLPPEVATKQVLDAAGSLEAAAAPIPAPEAVPAAGPAAAGDKAAGEQAPAAPSQPEPAKPATEPQIPAAPAPAPAPAPEPPAPEVPARPEPAPASAPAASEPKLEKPVYKVDKPIAATKAVLNKKSRLPILQNVKIEGGKMTATDLDVTTELALPDAPKDGIYKFVGNNLEPDRHEMADFPQVPKVEAPAGKIGRNEFIHEFERTSVAIASDVNRHTLQGVALQAEGGQVKLVATDGRRLSVNKIDAKGVPDGTYIIGSPAKVAKALRAISGDTLSIGLNTLENPTAISFSGDNGRVTTRLVAGTYPNYEQVLPKPTQQISVDSKALQGAMEQLAPYIKTLSKHEPTVTAKADPESITLTVQSDPPKSITIPATYRKASYPKISEGTVVMPMRGSEGSTFAVNPKFLNDAVAGVRGKMVHIGLGDTGISPIHVYGKDISLPDAPATDAEVISDATNPKPKRVPRKKKDAAATDSPGKFPDEAQQKLQAQADQVQPMDSRAWQVSYPREPQAHEGPVPEQNINKLKILDYIEREFELPIRGKATSRMGRLTAGHYEVKPELVRLKRWGELEVLFHEMFHHIDKQLAKQFGRRWKMDVVMHLPPKQRLAALVELKHLDYDQTQQRISEGIAEYGRLIISLPEQAAQRAPIWHDAFEKWLKKQAPDLITKLAGVRDRYNLYRDLGSEGRILSQIDFKGEIQRKSEMGEKFDKAVSWFKEKFIDEFAPIEAAMKDLGISGREPARNAFKMATYVKQKAAGIARTFVEKGAVDEYGNIVGPSLNEVLFKKVPAADMKSFITYGVARRSMILTSRGMESGFDAGDAAYIVEKYGKLHPEWAEIADNVTKWADHGIDWLVRAGGLGPQEAEMIRELNPVYLPFKRVFIDEVDKMPTGVGGQKMAASTNVHQIRGSGRPIINPIEAMIGQMSNMISRAHKVRVASLISDWANIPGAGKFIVKVPPPLESREISLEQIKGQLKELGVDMRGIDTDAILNIFSNVGQYHGKDNIVSIWKGGKRQFYELNKDLYRSLQGIDDLRIDNSIMRFLAAFARLKRLGATGLNAGFGLLRNPFKDLLTYKVFSRRSTTSMFDTLGGAYKDITAKPGDLAFRFKAAGGEISSQIGYDRAATMAVYDEMLLDNMPRGKILKVIKHPIDTLRALCQIPEMGPRIAELEGTIGKIGADHPDWSDESVFIEAFNNAQDVTVNFTRSGNYSKKINQVAAFFNAAMQGADKMARATKEDPWGTATKGVLYLSTLAIASWVKNKDEQWYKNLEPAYKYNNLFFSVGDTVFRLPIPFELGTVFMGVPTFMMDRLEKEDPAALKGLIADFKNFLPDPTPSAMGPAIDVARNKDYLGRPIESEGMKFVPQAHRVNYHTSAIARALGPATEALGIPLSPVQMDYLFYNYTGGLPKQLRMFGGQEMADLPIIGDVILRAPEKPSRQINSLFSELQDLRQRKTVKELQPGEPARLAKLEDVYRSTYKPLQDKINRLNEHGNSEQVRGAYTQLSVALARRGID